MPKPSDPTVRVRFAPSPTGMLHIGGARTALFNWLYARHTGGTFIVRIEDTDRTRLVPEAVGQITESLAWLGLLPNEGLDAGGNYGPYTQSERLDIYQRHAQQLLTAGYLYRSWETPEQLEAARELAKKEHRAYRYRAEDYSQDGDINDPHVLRFNIKKAAGELTDISWTDPARGEISFPVADQDDFVAVKSDGYPTYHFASVVDDHLMEISHVMRTTEWIPSTPKHLLVYSAFGWEPPQFVHLPVILGPDGKKKLSKRDGDVNVLDYRDKGYPPEAFFNLLASLGFNDGTEQEIFLREELISKFDLSRVQTSGAAFDLGRLEWMSGRYIRDLSVPELAERSEPFWPASATSATPEYKQAILPLVQERLKYLSELPELTDFFFEQPTIGKEQIELLTKRAGGDATIAASTLTDAMVALSASTFTEEALEETLRGLAENGGHKTGVLFGLIRISVTGRTAAPGLFETLAVLGKDATVERLKAAIDALV